LSNNSENTIISYFSHPPKNKPSAFFRSLKWTP
jgi:hypothetical protein